MSLRLNFACGGTRWAGFDNSDINGEPGTSYVDLEAPPYPYEDNSAELILMSHALWMTHDGTVPVHPQVQPILNECYRILKAGGWLRIDDNPWRCYDDAHAANEEQRGYPAALRVPRKALVNWLIGAGFHPIYELPTTETRIPYEDARDAILGNHNGHDSFTIEARK